MGDERITLQINAAYEVVDGKIAAWREHYDSVDLARQRGIEPNIVVEREPARTADRLARLKAPHWGKLRW